MGDCCSSEVHVVKDANTIDNISQFLTGLETYASNDEQQEDDEYDSDEELYPGYKKSLENKPYVPIVDENGNRIDELWQEAVQANDNTTLKQLYEKYHSQINFSSIVFENGDNSLHYAARTGNPNLTTFLIGIGVDINSINEISGNTALHYATLKSNINIAEVLLKHKCNTDIKNKQGKYPKDIAFEESDNVMLSLLPFAAQNPHNHNVHTLTNMNSAQVYNKYQEKKSQLQNLDSNIDSFEYMDVYHHDARDSDSSIGADGTHGTSHHLHHHHNRNDSNQSNQSHGHGHDHSSHDNNNSDRENSHTHSYGHSRNHSHNHTRKVIKLNDNHSNSGSISNNNNNTNNNNNGNKDNENESEDGEKKKVHTFLARGSTVKKLKSLTEEASSLPELESWLDKKKNKAPYTYQRRWVVVAKPYMLWNDKRISIKDGNNTQERDKFRGFLNIMTVTRCIKHESKHKSQTKFVIVAKDPKHQNERAYLFKCDTEKQRNRWVKGLNEYLQYYKDMSQLLS